jgi:hypothetical protein
MDAACVGKLSRERDVARVVEILDIVRRIKALDFFERDALKTLFPFETFTFLSFRHRSDINISHKEAQKRVSHKKAQKAQKNFEMAL